MPIDLHPYAVVTLVALAVLAIVAWMVGRTTKAPISHAGGGRVVLGFTLFLSFAASTCSLDGALDRIEYGGRYDAQIGHELFLFVVLLVLAAPFVFVTTGALALRASRAWASVRGAFALVVVLAPGALLALQVAHRHDASPPSTAERPPVTMPALSVFLHSRADYAGPCGRVFVAGATRLWLHCGQSLERDETPTWIEVTSLAPPPSHAGEGPVLVRVCSTTELGRSPSPCRLAMEPVAPVEMYTTPDDFVDSWRKVGSDFDLSAAFDARLGVWRITSGDFHASVFETTAGATSLWDFDPVSFAPFDRALRASDFAPPTTKLFAFLLPAALLTIGAWLVQRRARRRQAAIDQGLAGRIAAGRVQLDAHPNAVVLAPSTTAPEGPIVWIGAPVTDESASYRANVIATNDDLLSGTRDTLRAGPERAIALAQVAIFAVAAVFALPFLVATALTGPLKKPYAPASATTPASRDASRTAPRCPAGMTFHEAGDITANERSLHVPAFCVDLRAATIADYDAFAATSKWTPRDPESVHVPEDAAEAFCAARDAGLVDDEQLRSIPHVEPAAGTLRTRVSSAARFVLASGCEPTCDEGRGCDLAPSCLPPDAKGIRRDGIAVRCAAPVDPARLSK